MIPFVDLKAQHAGIRAELEDAIHSILDSCQFTLGAEVSAFEKEFAEYCTADFGVGVNSGTSALHLALLAAGVGPGDEVITVPFTFVATVSAINYTGARAVFVDIDPATYNMDVAGLEQALTEKTRAIVPVHLYGQSADMDPIMNIASERGIPVIEDAAQAHGAKYNGRATGSLGDMACFSFYPGKNLGACGEAGMVLTSNPQYDKTLRMLRDWGAEKKYEHVLKGYNYRMEGMQGAVLRVKLRYLERWTEARRTAAAHYDELLANTGIVCPAVAANLRHVYHIYAIRTPRREQWQQTFLEHDIQTGIHYPTPVHLLPAYADLGYLRGHFPHSELAADEVLSLPMFPEITKDQCTQVCDVLKTLVAE